MINNNLYFENLFKIELQKKKCCKFKFNEFL